MGRQDFFVCFYFGVGLVFRGFFKYIYIHTQSASLSKEVILQITELTPLQHMEYLDLSSKLSIQKWEQKVHVTPAAILCLAFHYFCQLLYIYYMTIIEMAQPQTLSTFYLHFKTNFNLNHISIHFLCFTKT